MLGLLATLAVHGVSLCAQQRFEAAVRQTQQSARAARPEAHLDDLVFTLQDGRPVVTAVVRSPTPFTIARVGAIGERLPPAPGGAVPRLRQRHVDVDVETDGP